MQALQLTTMIIFLGSGRAFEPKHRLVPPTVSVSYVAAEAKDHLSPLMEGLGSNPAFSRLPITYSLKYTLAFVQ